jgi:CRP-like cAMP-binding protein
MVASNLSSIFDNRNYLVRRTMLDPGQILFAVGTQVQSVFRLVSGGVRIELFPADGRKLVLYRASPGELIGADCLTRRFYGVAAISDEKSVVEAVCRNLVLDLIAEENDLLMAYFDCLTRQTDKLCESLERITIQSAKQRVLHLLISMTERLGSNKVNLKGRIKSLSSDLNLSHEATYRALRMLEEGGFIRRYQGGLIEVVEMPMRCRI